MSEVVVITPDDIATPERQAWAGRINTAWNKTLDGILETCQLLIDAKEGPKKLPHGQWLPMVEHDLAFGRKTAAKLMQIGRDPRITNGAHARHLPRTWTALYEVVKLSNKQFKAGIKSKLIKTDCGRMDIRHFLKAETRIAKHKDIAAKAAVYRGSNDALFSLIYADPPWEFTTYSDKGKDLSPAQHYPTMTADEIKQLTVGDRWIGDIAGDDALLFLWCTPANLLRALDVMTAWKFEYRSQRVWVKDKAGMGFYARQQHEPLLIGVRGNPPTPIYVPSSVIEAPRGKHSAKPDESRHDLEKMYPHWGEEMRIELFPRGPAPGWTVFGNES